MLYYCPPTFCDKNLIAEMYSSFVNMIRGQEQAQIDKFYSDVENIRESSRHEQFKRDIELIFQTRNIII